MTNNRAKRFCLVRAVNLPARMVCGGLSTPVTAASRAPKQPTSIRSVIHLSVYVEDNTVAKEYSNYYVHVIKLH